MLSPAEIKAHLERILITVQKPGRYVGGEYNAVLKDWDTTPLHLALVFPDLYDLGISNLGIQVLYDLVNDRPDALAERAYAPWEDMETAMRDNGIPLYSLESKHSLADFDLIGFTLPYESLYTNLLNLLDLAGLPLLSAERNGSHPLIIAGGHGCFNPEPMHAFLDAFVIGEGEEVIHEILDLLAEFRQQDLPRLEILHRLALLPGVYVPRFYDAHYHQDGTLQTLAPTLPDVPPVILKRMVPELPPPPVNFIVPNLEAVHNRVAVEVMRGCTRGCRFCQAGVITRPVRERSPDEVIDAARRAIRSTGYEELALLSLSSSDYTPILDLVDALGSEFAGRHLTVALPSLRIDTVSVDLMEKLKQRRSSGFTLAPEAASDRMRSMINKFIPDDDLLATAAEVYRRGWTTLKLYFMIGHPSETLEDVQAIVDLCHRVIAEGRRHLGGKAKLHAGVSTFIPKPHTPFQWVSLDTLEQIHAKQDLLKLELRDRSIKLTWTAPEETMLEAWLSRGDRRLADVIMAAWRRGVKFDAWQERFRFDLWTEAFAEVGIDPAFYTHRTRAADERFPWDHISSGVRKKYLQQEYKHSLEGALTEDCRQGCVACGILPAFASERRSHPGGYWKCPEVKSPPRKSTAEAA